MPSSGISAINESVVIAHRGGILTSTTMLVNRGAAIEEAVEIAKALPTLGVGLHLDLEATETMVVRCSNSTNLLCNTTGSKYHA
jgi:predicted glycoside hydrolase/deacetylase ChbG (UPF0249 family)